jgi:hypothetical protein
MSELVWSDTIPTQFGLISIRDFETADHPYVETGQEAVISTPGHVFVASQTDTDGDVAVAVRVGEPDIPGLRLVFDGVMHFNSSSLCVVAPADPDEKTVAIPAPGMWKVKIGVEGDPAHAIAIFFDPTEWAGSSRE